MTIRRLPVIQPNAPTDERPSGVYEIQRYRAKGRPAKAGVTIGLRTSVYVLDKYLGHYEPYPEDVVRPQTRGDCLPGGCNEERPCPFVSCEHHLYLDVSPTGSIQLNFAGKDVADLRDTCALDVADEGGATLDRTGEAINVTRARVEQIEKLVSDKARRRVPDAVGVLEDCDDLDRGDAC